MPNLYRMSEKVKLHVSRMLVQAFTAGPERSTNTHSFLCSNIMLIFITFKKAFL